MSDPRSIRPGKGGSLFLCSAVTVVVSVAVPGCSDAGDGATDRLPPGFSRSDSAGVEIVESARPLWTEDTRWRVQPEPAFVIRSPTGESDPEFVLFDVGDIVTLSAGRIVVENQGTNELLVFDASGAYVTTWGREGEGPGEFRRMKRMFGCPGDRILVQEVNRATVFDDEGDVVWTRLRRTPQRMREDDPSRVSFYGVSSDCSAVLLGWPRSRDIESPRETLWSHHGLAWVPHQEGLVSEPGTFVRLELRLADHWEMPFSLRPDWTTDGELLYYGLGDVPEVKVIAPDGSWVRSVRWRASGDPITAADWAAHEEGLDALVSYDPGLEVLRIEPAALPFDSMPVFGRGFFGQGTWVPGLRVDGDGNLWVRQFEPVSWRHWVRDLPLPIPAQRWWIFDADGRWLGELETPKNLHIREIRDGVILGVGRDDFDVEEVRAYRIVQPARG